MSRRDPRPPTVLVVDDEEVVARLLEFALGAAGFVVLSADGGTEAVEVFMRRRGEIDFVLLDVRMPEPLDGPATLLELRRLDPTVRAAFMSASTGKYTTGDLLALGAMRVFTKPFESLAALTEALRELVPVFR